ncbi:hypothetical protein SteCoe_36267 [Stentor coeruleus]|uniref:Uncharacterized protein n=1 Tax=Stentor coeruleus TaxID=5963 RepID=A0A1R2AQF7_9CILI|nr:hypothetical protein SteCoe_36267 [Stentor coeruleus]
MYYDNKNREAQEIDMKILKFKEDQLRKLVDKGKEQYDLRNLYDLESKKKQDTIKDIRNEIKNKDIEILNQAKLAMQRERSLNALRREQKIKLAEENIRVSLEKKKYERTLGVLESSEAKKQQQLFIKSLEQNEQKYQDRFKTIEQVQNFRQKQFEQSVLKNDFLAAKSPQINTYSKSPYLQPKDMDQKKSDDDLLSNFRLLEEQRKKERLLKESRMQGQGNKVKDTQDFDKNLKNFFGVDDDQNTQLSPREIELPSSSEFRQIDSVYSNNPRFAKTNLKSISHDPITGAISNYSVNRPKPRPLGTKPPEVFPGKIYDSPPQIQYEPPKNTKKAPRTQIFNPLTFETQSVDSKFTGPPSVPVGIVREEFRVVDKAAKSNNGDLPVANSLPIYKGMGYKKSSIFT